MDPEYPKPISRGWKGLPDHIDSAVNWQDGEASFFKGKMHTRWDIKKDRIAKKRRGE